MSLYTDFNIKQSDNAKEFTFTETTGAYNASTNVGGWGSPNEATSTATAVTLEVTPPGATAAISIDMSASYPTAVSTTEKTIRTQDLSLGTDGEFADGLWIFEYIVTTPLEGALSNKQTIFISGAARCCVYNMLADIDLCDCDGTERARALEAFTYYRSAIACAAVGDSSKFTLILAIIEKYCNPTC